MNCDINVCQRAIGAGQGRNRRWSWPTAQSALDNGAIGVGHGQRRNRRWSTAQSALANNAIGVGTAQSALANSAIGAHRHQRWSTPITVGQHRWPTRHPALVINIGQRRNRRWPIQSTAIVYGPVNGVCGVGQQPSQPLTGLLGATQSTLVSMLATNPANSEWGFGNSGVEPRRLESLLRSTQPQRSTLPPMLNRHRLWILLTPMLNR